MVERYVRDVEAGGSNPLTPTIRLRYAVYKGALHNFPGQKISITGPSNSGKSTLADLNEPSDQLTAIAP